MKKVSEYAKKFCMAVHTALVGTVMILGSVTLAAIVTGNVTITVSSDEEKEDK